MNDARNPPAAALVDEYFRTPMIPEPAGARRYVSPPFRILLTDGLATCNLAERFALNATRCRRVNRRIERTDELAGETAKHAAALGLAFEGSRYADRSVDSRDLIEALYVWSGSAGWLLDRKSGRA